MLARLASGEVFGPDTKVDPPTAGDPPSAPAAMNNLEGVAMELEDCGFPTLAGRRSSPTTRTGVRRAATGRCSSARPRASRAWSARTCSA